jgi:hypothetical protein
MERPKDTGRRIYSKNSSDQRYTATMDQITIKNPNPKCRNYSCLIEFVDLRYSHSFDQILNLQNCFTTPNKNLEEEGASDRETPAARSLYRPTLNKSRQLGLESLVMYMVHDGQGVGDPPHC